MAYETQFKEYFKELKLACEGYGSTKNELRHRILMRRGGMIRRCYNPTDSSYHEYGLRGIKVCDKWYKDKGASKEFVKWYCGQLAKFAGKYDTPLQALNDLSIDRISPKGNYTPKNCRLMPQSQNPYTTITPARCLMLNDEFVPFWYVEKNILGLKRFDRKTKSISDKIAHQILVTKSARHKSTVTPYMLLISGMQKFFTNFDKKEILKNTSFYVWYDFFKNPLIFNQKSLLAQCPECEVGNVDIIKYEQIHCKCDSCDFNSIIISNNKHNSTNEILKLADLPKKIWNKDIAKKIYADDLEKQRQYWRMRIFKETEEKRAIRLEKQREKDAKSHAKKQLKSGVDITKIRKKVRNECGRYKTPILELKTRKAIRERLKKEWENLTPQIRKKARELMVELLRKEKADRIANNPRAYYLARQRYNDSVAKRKKGADYVIVRKPTNLVKQTAHIQAKPRKKPEIKKEYFTQAELAQMGLIQDKARVNAEQNQKYFDLKMQKYKTKIQDKKAQNLLNEYLTLNKPQSITIKYASKDFVWQSPSDSIFCRCGEGVLRLDMQNKVTSRCVFCGFAIDFEGGVI